MAMIHVSRSGATLGIHDEEKVREGLRTGEFIGTDLGWMEGMPAWRPLSELDSFRTPPPPVVAQPLATPAQPAASVLTATGPRPGLPWENRDKLGWVNALLETIALVFTKPVEAFSIMKREGGFGDPILYALILGSIGAVISLGFSLTMQSVGIMSGRNNGVAALFGMGVGTVFMFLLIPVFIVVCTFIGAAITHVCLMIVGGAKQPFETTLRVLSYASGSANVLQVIPFCGGFLAGLAGLVLNCIGLARAHETDTWRAVVAVLLPLCVCCGGGMLLFFLFIGALAGTNWH
jgi:hypothetical protein